MGPDTPVILATQKSFNPPLLQLCGCCTSESDHARLKEKLQACEQQHRSDSSAEEKLAYHEQDSDLPVLHKLQNVDDIRLLKLYAGEPSETLKGELATSSLVNRPQYVALSYNWGEEQSNEKCSFSNVDIEVGETVARALRAIRCPQNHTYVWVDAICIDQKNRLDLAAHISQMDKVYRHAQFILCWLWQCAPKPDFWSKSWLRNPCFGTIRIADLSLSDDLKSNPQIPVMDKSKVVVPGTFTMQQFEDCRASLGRVLRDCGVDEYKLLGTILSAVAISFRLLSLKEITRIIALSLERDNMVQIRDDTIQYLALQGQYYGGLMSELESRIKHRWSMLFIVDESGKLSFRHDHMLVLIRSVELPGITPSHSFMADICLKELSLSAAASKSAYNFACHQCRSVSDFYEYSHEYWPSHYRLEQHQNPVLSGRVHSFLWKQVTTLKPGVTSRHESDTAACSIYCSECLDWIISYCSRQQFESMREIYTQLDRTSARRLEKMSSSYNRSLIDAWGHNYGMNRLSLSGRRDSGLHSQVAGLQTSSFEGGSGKASHMGTAISQVSETLEGWVMIE